MPGKNSRIYQPGKVIYMLETHVKPTRRPPGGFPCPTPPEGQDPLREELLSYKKLADGWDGYSALRPHAQTIDDAIRFVDRLPESVHRTRVPPPKPCKGGDGLVVLCWRLKEAYAEAAFMGDGTFALYSAIHKIPFHCCEDQEISGSPDGEMEKIASLLIELRDCLPGRCDTLCVNWTEVFA